MFMLAGPGNGKTHIIDTLCRAIQTQFFKRYCNTVQDKLNQVDADILSLSQQREISSERENKEEIQKLSEKKGELEYRISEIDDVEKILKEKIIFVPISFDKPNEITSEEKKLSPQALLVCRMLYFYFVGPKVEESGETKEKLSIESFLDLFYPVITSVSSSQALDAIRFDQEASDSDSDPNFPPLKPDNRTFIVVDEISKLGDAGLKDHEESIYRSVTQFLQSELTSNRDED